MYSDVIVRRVRVTIVAVGKKNKYYVFLCVSVDLGIKHATRMRLLWPVLLYYIFPHYLTTARFSKKKKKFLNIKMYVLIFSTALFQTLVIMRYDHKCTCVFM